MVYNGYYKVMSNIPKSWDIYQPLFHPHCSSPEKPPFEVLLGESRGALAAPAAVRDAWSKRKCQWIPGLVISYSLLSNMAILK